MQFHLTAEQESFVRQQVESGIFRSQEEVVNAALQRLIEEEQAMASWPKAELNAAIDAGLEDNAEGRVFPAQRVRDARRGEREAWLKAHE